MTTHTDLRPGKALLIAGVLIAATGLLLRAWLLATYPPVPYGDTGTYVQAARDLLAWDFTAGQARRTPGYPLLIALLGVPSPMVLVVVNMLSGVLIAVLLYGLVHRMTRRMDWALIAAGSYLVNVQQVFQETTLLTETLSALTVTGVVAWIAQVSADGERGQSRLLAWIGVGTLAAYAIFVRPQFIFFVALMPAVALYAHSGWHWPTRRALAGAALVVAPMLLAIFGWASVVKTHSGYFTLSTQSGFGMVNQAIDYIELSSDRFAPARDVLVRVREARIAEVGHARNTIWYAWPEIQRSTGWTLPEASAQMQKMCMDLFARHPLLYLRGVGRAWLDHWTVPIFWQPDRIDPPQLASALGSVWWVQHKLLRLANVAFVLICAVVVASAAARRRLHWDLTKTVIAATILGSSVVQALFDQGASSRYLLPTQPLVLVLLIMLAFHGLSARQDAQRAGSAPSAA